MRPFLFVQNLEIRPKICWVFFKNLSANYFKFTDLHSVDKFSKEQQILGLREIKFDLYVLGEIILFSFKGLIDLSTLT